MSLSHNSLSHAKRDAKRMLAGFWIVGLLSLEGRAIFLVQTWLQRVTPVAMS
jgi:hypothetical protein